MTKDGKEEGREGSNEREGRRRDEEDDEEGRRRDEDDDEGRKE